MMNSRVLSSTLDRMLTLNRALDQALAAPLAESTGRVWLPAMDVIERADAYTIVLELPGVDPRQVEVGFEQNTLAVRGTKPAGFEARAEEGVRVHASERVSGSFERALRLPDSVDSERITADFSNGLLTITVPKAQAARPRKIEVRTSQGEQIGVVQAGTVVSES